MSVLVTGAAGFLGRHVARAFRDQGWETKGFDQSAFAEAGIEPLTGDFTQPGSLDLAMKGVDVIAHVGAIGDVYLAGEEPGLAARVNVMGTANVIEAALRHDARLLYTSTWEVYGEPEREPITEDHPTMPDHPYSITKLAGESLVLAATRLQQLSSMALRLGTAYGSGMRPNSVFRIFIDKARRGEPITIQGDGAQGRQFTHASDIARAFCLAAASPVSGIPVNVVAPDTISIKELAEMVIERYPTDLHFGSSRPGDVPPALVSAERATEILGWQAVMPFVKGLEELFDEG
ncbi:MAG TPA: NAD-dependent epimerase/dehydratase family protein [Acidimicrobiia bacterium]|jgi:UDP-glucose 4-epimerase